MVLTSSERKERLRDSQRRWRKRNRDQVREWRRQAARTEAAHAIARSKYHLQRQELIAQGLLDARAVGRPCIYETEEERLAARRAQKRASSERNKQTIALRRAAAQQVSASLDVADLWEG